LKRLRTLFYKKYILRDDISSNGNGENSGNIQFFQPLLILENVWQPLKVHHNYEPHWDEQRAKHGALRVVIIPCSFFLVKFSIMSACVIINVRLTRMVYRVRINDCWCWFSKMAAQAFMGGECTTYSFNNWKDRA
jgi:hypothetical protein